MTADKKDFFLSSLPKGPTFPEREGSVKLPRRTPQKVKKDFSRPELREKLKKMPYDISIKMLREQRVREEKKLFPYQKYGPIISNKDIERRLSLLDKEKFKAPHTKDKINIEHEINLLKRIKGQKSK